MLILHRAIACHCGKGALTQNNHKTVQISKHTGAGTTEGRTLPLYPDLQALDLSQVSLLSLLQPPPLRILLLDKLHLSEAAGEQRD